MLRTPSAIDGEGGAISEKQARERNRMVQVRDQVAQLAFENGLKVPNGVANSLLPTPQTMDTLPARSPEKIAESKLRTPAGYSNLREAVVNDLLPTVTTQDAKNNGGPSQLDRNTVPLNTLVTLLPTPEAKLASSGPDYARANRAGSGGDDLTTKVFKEQLTDIQWGKFEPAIRRWEQVTGRPAPAPTKPDGKDDAHRLSSKFTEWMMGLPDGWITSNGLTRNEELKMAGNGVCPQQAELAVRTLLLSLQHDTIALPKEGN
jgi:DNA (cytosine-5)-methyltransferase 1